jgi:hypothetical protein
LLDRFRVTQFGHFVPFWIPFAGSRRIFATASSDFAKGAMPLDSRNAKKPHTARLIRLRA